MPTQSHRWAIVVFGLIFPSLVTWVYFRALSDHSAAWQQSAYLVGKVIQFGFPAVWCYCYCRQAFQRSSVHWSDLRLGIGFGLLVLLATFALYHGLLTPFPDAVATAVRE